MQADSRGCGKGNMRRLEVWRWEGRWWSRVTRRRDPLPSRPMRQQKVKIRQRTSRGTVRGSEPRQSSTQLIQLLIKKQVGQRWCFRGGSDPPFQAGDCLHSDPSAGRWSSLVSSWLTGSLPSAAPLSTHEVLLHFKLAQHQGTFVLRSDVLLIFLPHFFVWLKSSHRERGLKNFTRTFDKTENSSAYHSCCPNENRNTASVPSTVPSSSVQLSSDS